MTDVYAFVGPWRLSPRGQWERVYIDDDGRRVTYIGPWVLCCYDEATNTPLCSYAEDVLHGDPEGLRAYWRPVA